MPRHSKGFTLIELMIVVAIIGILAAIALPKMADLIRKSAEGTSKGNIGAIRSALSLYYGDNEGNYPADISSLTLSGKYLTAIPIAKTPDYHPDTSTRILAPIATANDSSGWIYDNTASGINAGIVEINCTHTDTKGSVWTNY